MNDPTHPPFHDAIPAGSATKGSHFGPAWRRGARAALVLGLFLLMAVVYWHSVPARFNTVRENRRFFDSDGEFITRQFRQGKTYTHNDHLLYHVAGRLLYDHAVGQAGASPDPVVAHKLLSVLAGAIAVASLFYFGYRATGSLSASLACALFMAGGAVFWFFSATIDTYMPGVCASILALGLALRCLATQRPAHYAGLGASMGLAFLLRTDAFLLGSLLLVLMGTRERLWPRLAAFAVSLTAVGAGGYALLAHSFYQVPWLSVPAWALGVFNRAEVAHQHWGVAANLTAANFRLVLANHGLYAMLLPELTATRSPHGLAALCGSPAGLVALASYLVLALLVLGSMTQSMARWLRHGAWRNLIPVLLAVFWFVPRIVFYTWWDPHEPFLFAAMSLPALWLCLLHFFGDDGPVSVTPEAPGPRRPYRVLLVLIVAAVIWGHNLVTMIIPLRSL